MLDRVSPSLLVARTRPACRLPPSSPWPLLCPPPSHALFSGLPVPSLDYKTLSYRCNALSCFYVTLVTSAILHITGLFDLTNIIDNFGPLMTVGMIVGFALSAAVYIGGVFFHWGGKPIRMSGWFVYDFFMGGQFRPILSTRRAVNAPL